MYQEQPKILIIEDEIDLLEFYIAMIEEDGDYAIYSAQTVEKAREHLQQIEFDVVLVDIMLQSGDRDGLIILQEVKSKTPLTQVIIFTGIGGTEEARQAQKLKADGYLTKPLDFDQLRLAVKNAIGWRLQRLNIIRQRSNKLNTGIYILDITPEQFVYACEPMKQIVAKVTQLAKSDTNVTIIGESGTGKGLLAEGIHIASGRHPFELVNCASLSEATLEQLIFGYHGENTEDTGLLGRLSGGTLVLDNISSLSLRLQRRLLDSLLDHKNLSSEVLLKARMDLRIIAIDEIDPQTAVHQKLFSSELYDLLVQETCYVPPLRERRDAHYKDVLVLATHFAEKYGAVTQQEIKFSAQVEYIFEHYPFPGNVRELQKVIRLALGKLDGSNIVGPEHLPARMRRYEIQPGLGVSSNVDRILCPHGDFYCNQTNFIVSTYSETRGIYLRLQSPETEAAVQHIIQRVNFPVVTFENIQNPLTTICKFCMAVQSSHYAIVEITGLNGVYYELGMLHALGVPTLILCSKEHQLPPQFGTSAISYFANMSEVSRITERWIAEIE